MNWDLGDVQIPSHHEVVRRRRRSGLRDLLGAFGDYAQTIFDIFR